MLTDYVPAEEYKKMYPFLSYENHLVLRVCLETGLRVGDVVALKPCELQGQELHFTAQKTKKQGRAKLPAELADKLRKIAGEQYIFSGNGKLGHRTRQAVWRDVKRASQLAGIKGNVSPHSARKTRAVNTFRQRGFSAAQRELQHSDPGTTMLYAFSDVISGVYEAPQNMPLNVADLELLAEMIANKVVERLEVSRAANFAACETLDT